MEGWEVSLAKWAQWGLQPSPTCSAPDTISANIFLLLCKKKKVLENIPLCMYCKHLLIFLHETSTEKFTIHLNRANHKSKKRSDFHLTSSALIWWDSFSNKVLFQIALCHCFIMDSVFYFQCPAPAVFHWKPQIQVHITTQSNYKSKTKGFFSVRRGRSQLSFFPCFSLFPQCNLFASPHLQISTFWFLWRGFFGGEGGACSGLGTGDLSWFPCTCLQQWCVILCEIFIRFLQQ